MTNLKLARAFYTGDNTRALGYFSGSVLVLEFSRTGKKAKEFLGMSRSDSANSARVYFGVFLSFSLYAPP